MSALHWHVDVQNHPYFKAERLRMAQCRTKQPAHHDTGCLVKQDGSRLQIACHASASGPPAQPFASQNRHQLHNEPEVLPGCNTLEDHQEPPVQEIITDPVRMQEKVCKLSSQKQHFAKLTACQSLQVGA